MRHIIKSFLWKLIYHSKPVHLGISLRLRKILRKYTYQKEIPLNDLSEFKVRISISAYNAEEWIGDTLKSIQNQTFRNWIVCVVDDGSEDKTAAIVSEFTKNDNRIVLYRNSINSGLNLTRNTGLKLAEKDNSWNVMAIVDADDVPYPYWLEIGLQGIKNGASVVRCINTRCSPDLNEKYYDYMSCAQIFATREIINFVGFYRPQPFTDDHDYMERLEKAAFLMNTFVVTTPIPCQLMRVHGNNMSTKEKNLEQLACIEYAENFAKNAKDLESLYVKAIVPDYTEIKKKNESYIT